MWRRNAWDLFAAFFLVVVIYVLVRPSSKGGDFIRAFSDAMTALVTAATDTGRTS
jgi:hypothetical protein